MTDLPISRQMLRAVAVMATHTALDMPGITLQEHSLWLSRRLRKMRGRTVWLGSEYGPESSTAKEWEHKRRPLIVRKGLTLTPFPANVTAIESAVGALRARGDLAVVLNNVNRFVQGMWVPGTTADWLYDGPVRRTA